MRSVASLALVLSILFPAALIADSSKEIQKLEKTLAGDRDASARAEAAWQLGQLGATEAVPDRGLAFTKQDTRDRAADHLITGH